MNRTFTIRPALVKEYHLRDRECWRERLDLLRERDAKYIALNEEYSNSPINSYHGQPDPAYDRRYKAISAEYDPQYEAIGERQRERRDASDITIPEFLLLDNFFPTNLAEVCARPDFDSLGYFSLIEAKANSLLAYWKEQFDYAGMKRRVEMEIEDLRFARKRCWNHFGFQLWDIDAWRQARLYRRVYAGRLRENLDRSRVA